MLLAHELRRVVEARILAGAESARTQHVLHVIVLLVVVAGGDGAGCGRPRGRRLSVYLLGVYELLQRIIGPRLRERPLVLQQAGQHLVLRAAGGGGGLTPVRVGGHSF